MLEPFTVGGISSRSRRDLELHPHLCVISHHARFSVGEPYAFLGGRSSAGPRPDTCLSAAGTLSRQNPRLHPVLAYRFGCGFDLVRPFLRVQALGVLCVSRPLWTT